MNSKVIQFSLLSVTLIVGVFIGMNVVISEAQVGGNPLTEKRIGPGSPKSFGSIHQGPSPVCGDRLCNQATPNMDIEETHSVVFLDEEDPSTPSTTLMQISQVRNSQDKAGGITYIITYRMTAGVDNLANIRVIATSDADRVEQDIASLGALQSSVNVLRIKALDPDSIDGGIVGYRITAPTGEGIDRGQQ
jgi:hypothetical protein